MNPNDQAMATDIAAQVAALEVEGGPHPQTGPLTEAGKEASKRNAVRHGLTGAGVVLPEGLRETVDRLRDEFAAAYPPIDDDDWRLIGQAALGFARFQAAIDEQTYYIADRSEQALASWGEAEAATAEKLGNRLADRPSWVVSRLLVSLAGCRWLLQQWRLLAAALDHSGSWDEARQATALHLLGIATIDHEADRSPVRFGTPDERRALAMARIEHLESRVAGDLARADANRLDRAIEGKGYMLEPGFLRLVRYENAALRMYEGAIAELKTRRQSRAAAEPPMVACLFDDRALDLDPIEDSEDGEPMPPAPVLARMLDAIINGCSQHHNDSPGEPIEEAVPDSNTLMVQEYRRIMAAMRAQMDEDPDRGVGEGGEGDAPECRDDRPR